ncbi:MAG TPA: DUF167 domain-containing protein [Aquifex aeolicus]|nr:DUF167 domain-containing protein [Aquifex aeolicus]
MLINVKVIPKARKEEVKKVSDNQFIVKVKEPPEKGKANERVIELLSEYFGIPKRKIKILRGITGRNKFVEIDL